MQLPKLFPRWFLRQKAMQKNNFPHLPSTVTNPQIKRRLLDNVLSNFLIMPRVTIQVWSLRMTCGPSQITKENKRGKILEIPSDKVQVCYRQLRRVSFRCRVPILSSRTHSASPALPENVMLHIVSFSTQGFANHSFTSSSMRLYILPVAIISLLS